jgi:hypothetical protein
MNAHIMPAAACIDTPHSIPDMSRSVMLQLIERIKKSRTDEQLVYRESEIDEVWLLIDAEIAEARWAGGKAADIGRLEAFKTAIMEVHDLIAVERNVGTAAVRLRESLLEFASVPS